MGRDGSGNMNGSGDGDSADLLRRNNGYRGIEFKGNAGLYVVEWTGRDAGFGEELRDRERCLASDDVVQML
jgi:hypothetical protein